MALNPTEESPGNQDISTGLRSLAKLIRESTVTSPDPPRAIGKFQIYRQLGRGGQSRVWLAYDPALDREVVLKEYHPTSPGDLSAAEQLAEEGRVLGSIKSPYVATCYGIETVADRSYLALEYIRGQSLQNELARRPFAPREAMRLVAQIAEGLAEIHRSQIVHGDLKPENIIISDDGTPKLIDFGIASAPVVEDSPRNLGTAAYMAPERLHCPSKSDHRSDLFSLGVICFRLVTGTAPFPTDSKSEALEQISDGDIPAEKLNAKEIAPWMRRICLRLLAASPGDRPQTARQVVDEIDDRLERKRIKRRSAFIAASLFLVVIAAAVFVALRRPESTAIDPAHVTAAPEPPPRVIKEIGLGRVCEAVHAHQPLYEMPLIRDIHFSLHLSEVVMDADGYFTVGDGQETTVSVIGREPCFIAFYSVEYIPGKGPTKCELIYPSPGFESTDLTPPYDPYRGITFSLTADRSETESFLYAVATDRPWDPNSLAELYSNQQADDQCTLRSDWRGFRRSDRFGEAVLPIRILAADELDRKKLTRQHDELMEEIVETPPDDLDHLIQLRRQGLSILQQIDPTNQDKAIEELAALAHLHEQKQEMWTASQVLEYARRLAWPNARNDLTNYSRRLEALAPLDQAEVAQWLKANQILEAAKNAFFAEQWELVEEHARQALVRLEQFETRGLEDANTWAHFLLAAVAMRRDEVNQARQHLAVCKTNVEFGADDAALWMQRIGHQFVLCGMPQEGEHWKGMSKTHLRSSSDALEAKLDQIRKQRSRGDFKEAEQATSDLLASFKSDKLRLARVTEGLGDICYSEGSIQFAYYHFDRALKIYKRIRGENCLEAARVNVEIARILREFGMYERQRWHLDSALLFLDENKLLFPKLYATALVQRGLYARDNWNSPDYGESKMLKGLALLPKADRNQGNYGYPLLELANLYLWQHRLDDAEAIYQRFTDEAKESSLDLASCRLGLAEVAYARGDQPRAEEIYTSIMSERCAELRRVRNGVTHEGLRLNMSVAWHGLGRYLSMLDLDDPVNCRTAYMWLHEIRKIASPLETPSAALPPDKRKEIQDLDARISRLLVEPDARRALDQFQPLWAQRGALEREFRSRQDAPPAPSWNDLLTMLPDDAALVDIVTFSFPQRDAEIRGRPSSVRRIKAFVACKDDSPAGYQLTCVDLGEDYEIQPNVAEWAKRNGAHGGRGVRRTKTTSPSPAPVQIDLDRFLYERIWMHIEPHLANRRTIVTLKSGGLDSLPLGAIRNHHTGRYLIEDYTFVHLSSIFQLPGLRAERFGSQAQFLAVGGLEFDEPPVDPPAAFHWQNLPESKSEVQMIAALYPENSRRVITGNDATRQEVVNSLRKAATVHFSTHGKFWGLEQYRKRDDEFFVDLRNMQVIGFMQLTLNLRHFLALSGANQAASSTPLNRFGLLSALEIGDLDLSHVDLVTLSACESASHQIPDGYRTGGGLPSAFLNAGAKSVIGSIWLVEDKAAKAIMVEFYRNHRQEKRSVGESLRAAQLAMIRGELNDELDFQGEEVPIGWWAPWVMYGDWR